MNTIIRGEEAWDRLERLPEEAADWNVRDGLRYGLTIPSDIQEFLDTLSSTPGKHLRNVVATMHDRLIHEREIANLQLLLLLDLYPWRHQVAFVFTQRYRLKFSQTGVRWWLHTVLATKIEDIALPAEPSPSEAHDARADMLDASESETAQQATSNEERTPVD